MVPLSEITAPEKCRKALAGATSGMICRSLPVETILRMLEGCSQLERLGLQHGDLEESAAEQVLEQSQRRGFQIIPNPA